MAGRVSVMGGLCADQAWLEDFMAKEKEVSGVKDEPEEGSAEGRDNSEADRQLAENGFSKGDLKAQKEAGAEPTSEKSEAVAAAGEGHSCLIGLCPSATSPNPIAPGNEVLLRSCQHICSGCFLDGCFVGSWSAWDLEDLLMAQKHPG